MENKCTNDHGKIARHVLQKTKSSNRQKPNAQNRSINFFPMGAFVESSPFSSPFGDGRVGNNSRHGMSIPTLLSAVKVSQDPLSDGLL